MSDKEHYTQVFRKLKPACDAFITEPNDVNSSRLKKVLAEVSSHDLERLQPYILIPLEIHLKNNKYESLFFHIQLFSMIISNYYLDPNGWSMSWKYSLFC